MMLFKKMALAMTALALLVSLAVAQEDISIFNVSNKTGMTPGVPSKESGVWTAPTISGSLANVAGGWTFALNDASARDLKLTLYQNNDAVFGSGDITVLGNTSGVSAGGTLKGNSLTLYVIPSGDPGLYMLTLIVGPGSMNGNYVFSSPGTAQQPGVASARQTEPGSIVRSSTTTVQLGEVQPGAQDKLQGPKGTAV